MCVSKLAIIGSENGLAPGRRQAIIWTNDGILLTWTLGTNFSEILIVIHTFSFKKMQLKCRQENGGYFVSASICFNQSKWHYLTDMGHVISTMGYSLQIRHLYIETQHDNGISCSFEMASLYINWPYFPNNAFPMLARRHLHIEPGPHPSETQPLLLHMSSLDFPDDFPAGVLVKLWWCPPKVEKVPQGAFQLRAVLYLYNTTRCNILHVTSLLQTEDFKFGYFYFITF